MHARSGKAQAALVTPLNSTTHLLQGTGDAAGVSTAREDRLGSAAMASGWRGQRSGLDAVQRMVVDGLASL